MENLHLMKQLRLGNWLQDSIHFKGFFQVECILTEMIDTGEFILTPDEVNPIELDEDWLHRFGFQKGDNIEHSDAFYVIKVVGSDFGINPENGVVWITRGKNCFNNPALIKHVHELQNIYFALSGNELVVSSAVGEKKLKCLSR
jgi:hypothetical protein